VPTETAGGDEQVSLAWLATVAGFVDANPDFEIAV